MSSSLAASALNESICTKQPSFLHLPICLRDTFKYLVKRSSKYSIIVLDLGSSSFSLFAICLSVVYSLTVPMIAPGTLASIASTQNSLEDSSWYNLCKPGFSSACSLAKDLKVLDKSSVLTMKLSVSLRTGSPPSRYDNNLTLGSLVLNSFTSAFTPYPHNGGNSDPIS